MGAFHDYVAIDPVTEKQMVVNFPVCEDNPYKIDVEKTKVLLAQYKPEFIIFGKSMVLYKEPVAETASLSHEQGTDHHHVRHGACARPHRRSFPEAV